VATVQESTPWITALSTRSATREKILEHRFLADVASELWRRGAFDLSVSFSEVDNSGYDVIIEVGDVVRHVQLKAMREGGKRRDFDLQLRLAEKPSGCAILMIHDAVTLRISGYRIFAGAPGEALAALGERIVRHVKGNAIGFKAERPALRAVALAKFDPVADVRALVDRLFGVALD
jgi:hypothetical protein